MGIYADARVGPHGILPFDERMEDARKRYSSHASSLQNDVRKKFVDCGREIEGQIFAHCKIKPEDITDEAVAPIIEELKNFVIK
jgi:hypothetical protein